MVRREPKESMVDFNTVTIQSLRAYKRYFKLPLRPNATKPELATAITSHWRQLMAGDAEESSRVRAAEDAIIDAFLERQRMLQEQHHLESKNSNAQQNIKSVKRKPSLKSIEESASSEEEPTTRTRYISLYIIHPAAFYYIYFRF